MRDVTVPSRHNCETTVHYVSYFLPHAPSLMSYSPSDYAACCPLQVLPIHPAVDAVVASGSDVAWRLPWHYIDPVACAGEGSGLSRQEQQQVEQLQQLQAQLQAQQQQQQQFNALLHVEEQAEAEAEVQEDNAAGLRTGSVLAQQQQ